MMLDQWQKKKLVELHSEGFSKSYLSRIFGVSRRTVDFVISPEKRKKNQNNWRLKNGWKELD